MAAAKGGIVAMEYECDSEEEDVVGRSEADLQFDDTVGHIEDVLISDDFQSLQDKFLEKHYKSFDNDDENKLEYTKIHQEYIDTVETYLERMLKKRMPGFDMERFAEQLVNRNRDELEGDVFDVLLTFSDFMAFREMMIDYGASRSGAQIELCVTGRNAVSLGLIGNSYGPVSQGSSKSATLQTLKAKHAAASANAATRGTASGGSAGVGSASSGQRSMPSSSASASASSNRAANNSKPAATPSGLQKIDLAVSNSARPAAASSAKTTKPTPTPLTKSSPAKPSSATKPTNATAKPK